MNGLFAEVQHYDEAVGRYAVLVLVTGEQIRVRAVCDCAVVRARAVRPPGGATLGLTLMRGLV